MHNKHAHAHERLFRHISEKFKFREISTMISRQVTLDVDR